MAWLAWPLTVRDADCSDAAALSLPDHPQSTRVFVVVSPATSPSPRLAIHLVDSPVSG